MNERQLEVQKAMLQQESEWQQELKAIYNQASADCESKIRALAMRDDMENLQSIVYQKTYQESIWSQLEDALNDLDTNIYSSMSEYLEQSYEEGFLGTLYDLQGQGIPLAFPIEQDQVIQAIQLDSKISQGLYTKLGEDVDVLKKAIQSEVSTGIANGSSWNQMATMIAKTGMNSRFSVAYNRSILIARTEAHRIQQKAALDCQYKAKEKGADIKKVWDSTMDSRTRPTHVSLDGQVREVEEEFEVGGKKAMYPGGFGSPEEDCNCRCCVFGDANWGISDTEYTKMNGDTNELVRIESTSYNDFKEQVNGLSATNEIKSTVPEHKSPEIIGNIDFSDKEAVSEVISTFEKEAVTSSSETACVITKNGTVYKCYGVEDEVYPNYDLGDELYGAIVSHNHPSGVTQYSFSSDDFQLFRDYNLEVLRGVDEKYTYEFTRNSDMIDEPGVMSELNEEEDFLHEMSIINATNNSVGYRRWSND